MPLSSLVTDRVAAAWDESGGPTFLLADQRGPGREFNGKPSLSVDDAAVHLTRANLSWGALGQAATISFAFRATGSGMPSEVQGFTNFTAVQIQATLLALQAWSDVAGITFVRQDTAAGYSNNATMLFGNYSSGADGAAAFAYLPGSTAAAALAGDVWVNASLSYNAAPTLWGYGQMALVHEIGHALGLLHPSDYDAAPDVDLTYGQHASYHEDSNQFTLMSYFGETSTNAFYGASRYASAPLLDDIAAAQRLYGANMSTRTEDTVYGFNSTAGRAWFSASEGQSAPIFAVWDAGGIDTLDFSGYETRQLIDLRQGSFSNTGILVGNVSIAIGAVIENAIGGSGDDVINGNSADNRITPGAGHNQVEGGLGTDTLVFSRPLSDYTVTSDGRRGFISGPEGTTLFENVEFLAFSDVTIAAPPITRGLDVSGDMTDDEMNGTEFSDDLTGGGGNDVIYGAGDGDQLYGGRGDDLVDGGAGNDRLYVDHGDDIIIGGEGIDTLSADMAGGGLQIDLQLGTISGGGLGVDQVSGIERVTGSRSNDLIIGGDEDNHIQGFGGIDTLRGGGGDDELIAAYALAGGGPDVIKTADEANGAIASAVMLDEAFDRLPREGVPHETLPHATVIATTHGGLEYFAFTVGANADVNFDIDGATFDSTLRVFDAAGTELAANDDYVYNGDGGFETDSFLNFRFVTAGTYYVQIGQYAPSSGVSEFGTMAPAAGLSYTLHVTIPGHAVQPTYNQGSELHGDAGNDILRSSIGNDHLDGGSGLDTAIFSGVRSMYAVTVVDGLTTVMHLGEGGVDTVRNVERLQFNDGMYNAAGLPFGGPINGTAGADELYGTDADDIINGLEGDDVIDGGAGDDVLEGGASGMDTLAGADGIDTVSHASSTSAVEIYLDSQVTWDGVTMDFLSSIENAIGSAHADYIGGDAGANHLDGDDGDDFLDGGDGDDVLVGGLTGLDHLRGGAGVDLLTYAGHGTGVQIYLDTQVTWDGVTMDFLSSIENAIGSDHADYIVGAVEANVLTGAAGDDFLYGMGGDDHLFGGVGVDWLHGGEGADTIAYAGSAAGVEVYLDTGVSWDGTSMDFLDSIENVTGSDQSDYMVGAAGANILIGGDGNDFLYGMAGDDLLIGGIDVDRLHGGDGIDTITYADWAAGVEVNLDAGVSWDGTSMDFLDSIENAIGSDHSDYMVGRGDANQLIGGAGDDFLTGGGGIDTLDGGAGTDMAVYSGNRAGYTISLSGGVTTVSGPDGTDSLTGVERLQFADGLFDINGDPLAASAGNIPQVLPAMADDKFVVGPEVLPLAPSDPSKESGFEVMPTVLVDKTTVGPEVLPMAPDEVANLGDPAVMPTIDDSFVLTGKADEFLPVLPTVSDEIDPWIMPTVLDPGLQFLSLALQGSQHAHDHNLLLLDECLTAPSRSVTWE